MTFSCIYKLVTTNAHQTLGQLVEHALSAQLYCACASMSRGQTGQTNSKMTDHFPSSNNHHQMMRGAFLGGGGIIRVGILKFCKIRPCLQNYYFS